MLYHEQFDACECIKAHGPLVNTENMLRDMELIVPI